METEKKKTQTALESFMQEIEQKCAERGLNPPRWVDKSNSVPREIHVSFRRPIPKPAPEPENDLIANMTPEEFKQKAMKLLMEQYGYSREQAEAAVNAPY